VRPCCASPHVHSESRPICMHIGRDRTGSSHLLQRHGSLLEVLPGQLQLLGIRSIHGKGGVKRRRRGLCTVGPPQQLRDCEGRVGAARRAQRWARAGARGDPAKGQQGTRAPAAPATAATTTPTSSHAVIRGRGAAHASARSSEPAARATPARPSRAPAPPISLPNAVQCAGPFSSVQAHDRPGAAAVASAFKRDCRFQASSGAPLRCTAAACWCALGGGGGHNVAGVLPA
jgi:hypothetical protein